MKTSLNTFDNKESQEHPRIRSELESFPHDIYWSIVSPQVFKKDYTEKRNYLYWKSVDLVNMTKTLELLLVIYKEAVDSPSGQ